MTTPSEQADMFTARERRRLDEAKAAWASHVAKNEADGALELFEPLSWQAGYYERAILASREVEADTLADGLARLPEELPVTVDSDLVVERYIGARVDADYIEVLVATEEGNVAIRFPGDKMGTRVYGALVPEPVEADARLAELVEALTTIAEVNTYESCLDLPFCQRWNGEHDEKCAVSVASLALAKYRAMQSAPIAAPAENEGEA